MDVDLTKDLSALTRDVDSNLTPTWMLGKKFLQDVIKQLPLDLPIEEVIVANTAATIQVTPTKSAEQDETPTRERREVEIVDPAEQDTQMLDDDSNVQDGNGEIYTQPDNWDDL